MFISYAFDNTILQKRKTEFNFLSKLTFTNFFGQTLTKEANNVRKKNSEMIN